MYLRSDRSALTLFSLAWLAALPATLLACDGPEGESETTAMAPGAPDGGHRATECEGPTRELVWRQLPSLDFLVAEVIELSDGSLLAIDSACGEDDVSSRASRLDLGAVAWRPAAPVPAAVCTPEAVPMPDARVLVIPMDLSYKSEHAWVYRAQSDDWVVVEPSGNERISDESLAPLANGDVLVSSSPYWAIFDHETLTWSARGNYSVDGRPMWVDRSVYQLPTGDFLARNSLTGEVAVFGPDLDGGAALGWLPGDEIPDFNQFVDALLPASGQAVLLRSGNFYGSAASFGVSFDAPSLRGLAPSPDVERQRIFYSAATLGDSWVVALPLYDIGPRLPMYDARTDTWPGLCVPFASEGTVEYPVALNLEVLRLRDGGVLFRNLKSRPKPETDLWVVDAP